MANTVNEIKRHVTGGQTAVQLERQPAELHLGEAGGMLWASNRYWVTPATRVAALLRQYNLSADAPGSFEVNGTVRATDRRPVTSMPDLLDLAKYPEPAFPVKLGGRAAHVLSADGKTWLAVYQTPGGELLGLRADALPWLTGATSYPVPIELGDGEHFGEVRVLTQGHGNAPVLLVADVIKTITPGSYGTDPDTHEQTWTDAVTENLGPRVVGALMALKLAD